MNLLPKSHEDFSKADYWNSFFKKRGKKAFEWYGEFPELSSHLFKYVKPKDESLIVGCGNSKLGMDLYDAGYKNIVNIDLSEVVIRQMQESNKTKRPDLIFQQMDATNMTFDKEKFSVILDKGTLDALMPDSQETTVILVTKYFQEMMRVLKNNGRYICISLLQEHILEILLKTFSSTCALRIVRCHDAETKARDQDESSMPVFMVICTKFFNLPKPILEIALVDGPPVRLSDIDEVLKNIMSVQESAALCNNLSKSSVAHNEEVSLDLYKPGSQEPRYTVYILDKPTLKEKKSYAVFIVPQGREVDWIFGTKQGRQNLLSSVQYDRLAIVILRRGQHFSDLETIKSELGDSVKHFAPFALSGTIPFLSLGSDIGNRKICYEGKSDFSGSFVVEEIETGDGLFRRLIFLNNQFVVQSEARLKKITSRRKKIKFVVDPHYLACDHHLYMSVGLKSALQKRDVGRIIIIGLGGGGLCTFIRQYLPQADIIVVEIDECILKVAKEYFDLAVGEKMQVNIADGIEYIRNSVKQKEKYDAILLDVDSKDQSVGMSCPPKQFVELDFLEDMANCLTDDGILILNLVARNVKIRTNVIEDLRKVFKFVASYQTSEDVNKILFCTRRERDFGKWRESIKESAEELNKQTKLNSSSSTDLYEITSLLNNIRIED
ncbi:hypothetical protein QAD02_024283 [Eretmocerus hayati]|uniref:Uncharacterized protein n=1 Tax=Eretmocerus hayati TaxID=131215 RepID=A0ACC2PZB9_9HYME|nr:hypothetical protein QAD02_024283 [Eretmocerus hayati]